jgi:hypothetical protein
MQSVYCCRPAGELTYAEGFIMPKIAKLLDRKTLIALGWTDAATLDLKEKTHKVAPKKNQESDEEMIRRLEREWDEKKPKQS